MMQFAVKAPRSFDCTKCSHYSEYRPVMPGDKGWRSPLPNWWVDEANDRLKRRRLDKKALAHRLAGGARPISEMMVLRALHPQPAKRVATLETIEAISDVLGIPRPIVVARTLREALELHATMAFDAADADRLRIAAEVDRENALRREVEPAYRETHGRTTKPDGAMEDGGARAERSRPQTPRLTPRAR